VLPVGNWIKNGFIKVMAKLNHLFIMAGWTEPATAAAKCQWIFVVAVRAFNAGEH
jgi:hypothetical protein